VRHLTNSGMPVAAAVALRDGDTVGVLDAPEGIRPFAMAEWVPGAKPQAPYADSLYRTSGRRWRASTQPPTRSAAATLAAPFEPERKSARSATCSTLNQALQRGARGLYFYDFDLAWPGWQVGDLTGALSTKFADAFLAGYTAVRRLPPNRVGSSAVAPHHGDHREPSLPSHRQTGNAGHRILG
jgi:hypothetical protein